MSNDGLFIGIIGLLIAFCTGYSVGKDSLKKTQPHVKRRNINKNYQNKYSPAYQKEQWDREYDA